MREAGVGEEHCHPHVLRHTFPTLYMQRDGARLEQLQLLMGHASIDTTAQYLHTTADELEARRRAAPGARDFGLRSAELRGRLAGDLRRPCSTRGTFD